MKRLLVAVLVLAGCASRTPPEERPLPPGMVAVATFTAEADPVAGTFTIRTEPTAAGRAQGMAALLKEEVLLQNDGAYWFESTDLHGCPAGTPKTWGANVKVSSLLGSGTWLSGVYAEITSFAGPIGSEACNGLTSQQAPEGLRADRGGLWSYPTIGNGDFGGLGPQIVTWSFTWVSATQFTFSGRIVAAKVKRATGIDNVRFGESGEQVLGDTGTGMVFSSSDEERLQFVNYDGTSAGVSGLLNGYANSIGPAVADSMVWFTTELNAVGFVTTDVVGQAYIDGGGRALGGIVADPTLSRRAWFRSNQDTFIRSIDRKTGAVELGAPIDTFPNAPWGMGTTADGYLYVTAPSENWIMVFTTGATGGAPVTDFETRGACSGPMAIMEGPDGKIWFTAQGDGSGGVVCSFVPNYDPAHPPVPAPVNTANDPMQLSMGPDGNVWVAANGANEVARMDASGPGYRITLPTLVWGAYGVATGDGKLWATDSLGILYPIVLDPDL